MEQRMDKDILFMLKQKKRRKFWSRALSVMMCVVVFCTTYALILPAITKETDTFCGIEAHTHTEDCYDQTLLCESHVHDEACFEMHSEQICGLEETEGHTHGETCVLQMEKVLSCEREETEGHTHTEACSATEQVLSCGLEETAGHTHTEACTSKILTCSLPEDETHTHSDSCYTTEYICGLEEGTGHSHTEDCYTSKTVYVCGMEEHAGHQHGDTCWTEVAVYSCGLQETEPHVHTEACFETTQVQICTIETDPEHEHTESCYAKQLICELEEHEHSLPCYADPNADLETAKDWEASLPAELSGVYAKDVLAIAKSQLGYTESVRNYQVSEDGETKGYTRYGAWYGIPYGDWCAMFVSFCYHYAGVEGVPLHCNCPAWINELKELGLFHGEDDYIPNPGDLIFFDWNANGESDHVGLVTEVDGDTVKTIEGNSANSVRYESYALSDNRIQGYGALPVQEKEVSYLCGLDAHVHNETCHDAEGNLICSMEEHTHTEACWGKKLFYTDNMIRAFVTIKGVEVLPEDLSVMVWEITAEEDPATFQGMQDALLEKMVTQSRYVQHAGYYGMELQSQGEPYELPEEAKVTVDVEFVQPLFTAEEMENAAEMKTFMLTPQEAEPEAVAEEETQSGTIALMRAFSPRAVQEEEAQIESVAYTAEPVSGENYGDSGEGLTGVSFRTGRIANFAVAVATDTLEGTFWTRVTNINEITNDGTYMIVSAEGNYALTGNSNRNYQAVTVQTVKGNTEYYTISGSDDMNLRWIFTKSGNGYTIKNQGTNQYVNASSERFITNDTMNIKISYHVPEKCWRLTGDVVTEVWYWETTTTYYLRNAGTGAFTRKTDADTTYQGTFATDIEHYYTADMLIFKLSDKTELSVPKDVEDVIADGETGQEGPEKPDYDDFIVPSGSKQGDTAVTDANDSTKLVSGKYYSDPATSDLETNYRKDTYAESEAIDGKVMTDKSVIYGDDDYDVFDSYAANTFGVTLSALGQEYPIAQNDIVTTPVDVVFVLDVSGSMTVYKTEDGEVRLQALSRAFNEAATDIMNAHEANRIGVALYSSGAWEMLPLDRYDADTIEIDKELENGQTVKKEIKQLTRVESVLMPYLKNNRVTRQFLVGTDSLKNEAGTSYKLAGYTGKVGGENDIHQGIGTYTQAGIAQGYEILKANTDTTWTDVINEGTDYEREYTVTRQPVIILLSDGEPTHATNIFMDPLNGPHYGDGNGDPPDDGVCNINGIQGYYTILSANYFKRMTGIHYEKEALFYTIGFGIKKVDEDNDDVNYDAANKGSGDRYKRAVLNPTQENLDKMTANDVNGTRTSAILKGLLSGTITDQAIQTRSLWPDPWTGVPHIYTPVLHTNPYAGDFNYADGAYFGQMSKDELTNIFNNILTDSQVETPYGFLLYSNTTMDISDTIGDGMEIKGDPVLRYGGRNYTCSGKTTEGNVTTYIYSGTYVDPYIPDRTVNLEDIIVTVTINDEGRQVVNMHVPDQAMPTYTPELIGKQYYYEALPVRLVYQVGLTEESQQAVLALADTGGKLTFYTNVYEGNVPAAGATLVPSTANPFYTDVDNDGKISYQPHTENKTENTTDTVTYHVDCSMGDHADDETIYVYHKLGNNGKLEFTAEKPELKIPVEKRWEGVNADAQAPLTITLYKVVESANSATATALSTIELNKDNGWKGSFDKLAMPGNDWYYAIGETVPEGFVVIYDGETIKASLGDGDSRETVMVTKVAVEGRKAQAVTIKNIPCVELPNTGGAGTQMYTTAGLLLMLTSAAYLMYIHTKRRKEVS